MWLDRDDARSDVVLAAAAAALGPGVLAFLLLPILPTDGIAFSVVVLAVMFTAVGLVPYLLARYRDDVPGAFGLGGEDGGAFALGLSLAAPTILLFGLTSLANGASFGFAFAGRLQLTGPALGAAATSDILLRLAEGTVMAIASWLLVTFLAVRGRDGFRANEMDTTEALRTAGLALCGASLLLGLLRVVTGFGLAAALLTPLVAFVLVLIADRQVEPRTTVNRPMLLTPVVTVIVVQFLLDGGGFFGGNLLEPLHRGASGAVLALVVATLVSVKRTAATFLLVAAVSLYPSCLSPIPTDRLLGITGVC